jgi:hypothetical protein
MTSKFWLAIFAIVIGAAGFVVGRTDKRIPHPSAATQTSPAAGRAVPKPSVVSTIDGVHDQFAHIQTALAKKADADFKDTPIADFAAWVGKQSGVQVEIDRRALADAGIELNTKVNLRLSKASLGAILHYALSPLDITYCLSPQGAGISITTSDAALIALYNRVYDVADLISSGDPHEQIDLLVEQIASLISASSWDDVGGAGNIHPFAGLLVVSQTFEVHRQIEQLLATLRTLKARHAAGDIHSLPALPDDPDDVALNAALDKRCDLDVSAMPLAKFAEFIAAQQGINVLIEKKAFEDAGISPLEAEVSVVSHGDSVRHCLGAAMKPLDVTFIVQRGVVLITTRECFEVSSTIYYPVADLAARAGVDSAMERDGYEAVAEILRDCIAPSIWSAAGGSSQIKSLPEFGSLSIVAPDEIQPQIAELLAQLRSKVRKSNPTPADADQIVTRTYTIPTGDDQRPPADGAGALAKIIRDTIAPDAWKAGDVQPGDSQQAYLGVLPDRIVVRAKRPVQREIQKLLGIIYGAAKSEHSRGAP